ncbi:MAG: M23 family metallopeptidase [Clostridia bacterium]|nr:M23 family metallopeptidase [Clostridia bacterium]
MAKGFGYSHYDDFGDSRSFGFTRRHLGNDLLGSIGTPVVAVEGGYVECIGWNVYGGWRIGIRSFDKKRYYYYAHLRKNHPYAAGLKVGSIVKSGDVIGYLGMTGYSTTENVNNMTKPHLHFGMELVFNEAQKESNNEVWINVYNIVNLLSQNRVAVRKDDTTKEYHRVYDFMDLRYQEYYTSNP